MPKTPRIPCLRHHRASGQAAVVLDGRWIYLGRHGTTEAEAAYRRTIAEWLTTRRAPAPQPESQAELTINGLILAYFRFASTYYRKDGEPTSEVESIRQAMKPLRRLYGPTPAPDFGPLALMAVREEMIRTGWARTHINRQINRVRRAFKWAAANELLPVTLHQALATVEGLRLGRTAAKEQPPVQPVPDEIVEATLPHMPPMVADMVRVQRWAGLRSQDVLHMKGAEIERTDDGCWVYCPARHKSEHHGRRRVLFLGPRVQAVLSPYIEAAGSGYLFSPRRSEEARNAARREGRRTPRWPSHCKRTPDARSKRAPGEHYTKDSYRWAIRRACLRVGVPVFFPHQLRHSAATAIRARYGLEAAQVILGHAELSATQVYAEADLSLARSIMAQVG